MMPSIHRAGLLFGVLGLPLASFAPAQRTTTTLKQLLKLMPALAFGICVEYAARTGMGCGYSSTPGLVKIMNTIAGLPTNLGYPSHRLSKLMEAQNTMKRNNLQADFRLIHYT
ncbi:uncharacterized protein LOC117187985 [Drosophila miranda]|uniref:uncharacterized protein LOC117187985 n=1 Tax=Drosophila miranda TaxID=7229 RepID=UPI00143F16E2|nr:uncharacterized protein LOC117187985 [Drosophila miranda]